ncbi:PKD domain-containing protein [Algibacter sp.]|uniref:PKD domain-containing protein n=1 Tax=Algibacter sp. TaxID=1872428 RepID=UPI003C72C5E7
MNYKLFKKLDRNVFALLFMLLGLISCYDSGYEEFVPPTGNVNNIQPNSLFTTSVNANDNLSIVFRSYSTDAASYLWDFGDGNTSTEANPDYKYATGGLYTVTLTTTSSDGLKATATSEVAPMFVDFNFTKVDSEVTFENLTNGAKSLVWDFGDGETIEWNVVDTKDDPNFSPIHAYKTAETFKATLTATNFLDVNVAVTKSIEGLVLSTVPDFTFEVSSLKVNFMDASILAVSHSWDFGDGNTSTELNPTHTYAVRGTYDVTLTTTNDAGVSKSITKIVPVGGVEPTFAAIVQNGTGDVHQNTTGDNADAWDMTPNSTVIDDVLGEIDSPYRALWNNTDLNSYIDATFCTNEQPGSTSDGNKFAGLGDRGVKIYEACRRLYQVVEVEVGVEYIFTIDSRSEAEGVDSEVFILNNEITTEDAINTVAERDVNADAYFVIDNDFNEDKSSSTNDTFTTNTFTFKPTTNKIVIYVRASNSLDGSTEVFYDNIDIITPGF